MMKYAIPVLPVLIDSPFEPLSVDEFDTLEGGITKYTNAIEALDGEPLEDGIIEAVAALVAGCKSDASMVGGVSNWDALTWFNLWCGPRTRRAAAFPLKGLAAEFVGFADEDYDRVLGFTGASGKQVRTAYFDDSFTQNLVSMGGFVSWLPETAATSGIMGSFPSGSSRLELIWQVAGTLDSKCREAGSHASANNLAPGFLGISRAASGSYDRVYQGQSDEVSTTVSASSNAPGANRRIYFFSRGGNNPFSGKLNFAFLGEGVSLTNLRDRMKTYVTAVQSVLGE